MSIFAKELELTRKNSGFTQYMLAKELKLSRSHFCRIENGERNPNKDLIINIAQILNLDSYSLNKLLFSGGFEPEWKKTDNSFKICFHMALEFKNKGHVDEAFKVIEYAMGYFDNMIKLNALLANLNLLKKDYIAAINANNETLIMYDKLKKKDQKDLGISKAEIIHNLGYVYFERGLEKNREREKLIAEDNNSGNSNNIKTIELLKSEIVSDFGLATEKIETAFEMEPDNTHILDQLARLYYHKADLSDAVEREKYFSKSLQYYKILISDHSEEELNKKQEASVFIALILAKLKNLSEATLLINTIINYKPLYYLGYYVKSCIFAINGKDNIDLLTISFESLKQALNIYPNLKNDIIWELDLFNLRFNSEFNDKFMGLISNN